MKRWDHIDGHSLGLLTDLYQLTMAACYVGEGLDQRRASFELFVRRLPEGFGYLIAAGLETALDYLKKLQFTAEQLAALKATGIFAGAPAKFWDLLAAGRFTGDVWAVESVLQNRLESRRDPGRRDASRFDSRQLVR